MINMSMICDGLASVVTAPFNFGKTYAPYTSGVVNVILSGLLLWYLYSEDFSDSLDYGATNDFAIYVMTGRSVLFILSIVLGLMGVSVIIASAFQTKVRSALGLDDDVDFSVLFLKYASNFVHTSLSLLMLTVGFLYTEEEDRQEGAEGKFLILWIAGGLAVWYKFALDIIGTRNTSAGDQKHAKTPAIVVAISTLLYVIATGNNPDIIERIFNKGAAVVLLLAYIVVALLDKSQSLLQKESNFDFDKKVSGEWTNFFGFFDLPTSVMALVSYPLVIYSGIYVGIEKTKESVVLALAVIVIDSMRIGRMENVTMIDSFTAEGQKPVKVWTDTSAALYRIVNGIVGIFAFSMIVVVTASDEAVSVEPLLYSVALVSALIKIMSVFFGNKDMRMPSAEHNFRSLSSVGLLVVSAYLWAGGTWFTEDIDKGWSITFFILALFVRFLDAVSTSAFVFLKQPASLTSWIMPFAWGSYNDDTAARDSVHKPTYDNPRVWLVLLSLCASLAFQLDITQSEWSKDVAGGTSTTIKFADSGDELTSHAWAAFGLTITHIVVVICSMVPVLSRAALSRMPAVRFIVSTAVLSCIVVVAGQLRFGSTEALHTPDSPEQKVISALISYIVADALGDGLL